MKISSVLTFRAIKLILVFFGFHSSAFALSCHDLKKVPSGVSFVELHSEGSIRYSFNGNPVVEGKIKRSLISPIPPIPTQNGWVRYVHSVCEGSSCAQVFHVFKLQVRKHFWRRDAKSLKEFSLWRAAILHPKLFAKFRIFADETTLILPSAETEGSILEVLDLEGKRIGPRFQTLGPFTNNRYTDHDFGAALADGLVLRAARGPRLIDDQLSYKRVAAMFTTERVYFQWVALAMSLERVADHPFLNSRPKLKNFIRNQLVSLSTEWDRAMIDFGHEILVFLSERNRIRRFSDNWEIPQDVIQRLEDSQKRLFIGNNLIQRMDWVQNQVLKAAGSNDVANQFIEIYRAAQSKAGFVPISEQEAAEEARWLVRVFVLGSFAKNETP